MVTTAVCIDQDDVLVARLLGALRALTGISTLVYATPPEQLLGGFEAELMAFRLAGAPAGLSGALVARVIEDPAVACKETIIQSQVAEQGYPTPRVHCAGGPEALGRAFMIMDRVAGVPLLSGVDGRPSLVRLWRLLFRSPRLLADVMVRLHGLNAAPARARLDAAGDRSATVAATLAALRRAASDHQRGDLVKAIDWLANHQPPLLPEVICHGDLHPANLLVDDAENVTVLDWSASLLAPRAYDVAFTSFVLADPPLAVPRLVRPILRAVSRTLARRFLRRYRDRSGVAIDDYDLRWFGSLVCLRGLVTVSGWVSDGHLDSKSDHPLLLRGSALASQVSALTGVPVRPR